MARLITPWPPQPHPHLPFRCFVVALVGEGTEIVRIAAPNPVIARKHAFTALLNRFPYTNNARVGEIVEVEA
jgi:hypothetical protein